MNHDFLKQLRTRIRVFNKFRARIHKIEDWTVKGEPLWWNARNAEDVKLMIKMIYAAVAGLTKYWRRWGKTKNRWNSFSARVGSFFPSLWWIPLSRSKQAFRQVVTCKHLSFAKCFHITECYHSSSSHISSSTSYDMQNVQRLFLGAPQSLQKSMPQFVHLQTLSTTFLHLAQTDMICHPTSLLFSPNSLFRLKNFLIN